ncbi:MAG TPA: hypothetical protein VGD42_18725 [Lysobacter sp.]
MRYCYFADYEIQMGDRLRVWGQATLVHETAADAALDPARVLERVRQQAADEHGVRACEVRVRALHRLD